VAVYLYVRAVIYLFTGARVVQMERSASGQPAEGDLLEWFWHRLNDGAESDDALSLEMSTVAGRVVHVATYPAPF
jgi:hypothetical protein